MSRFIKAARVNEIGPGTHKIVEVDGVLVVLINLDGTYYAIEDQCTHDGGPLGEGKLDPATGQIICPRHGAHFDVRTGAALTLPAIESVPTFEVHVEGTDVLVEAY